MRTRIVVSVVVVAVALGLGWFVGAQNGTDLPSFNSGDILTAEQLNAIVAQVEANTDAIEGDDTDIFTFTSTLSRAQEIPTPNGGTLTGGELTLQFNPGLTRVDVTLTLEGSSENTTRAHLHCNRAGLTGPIPIGFVDPGPCDLSELQAGELECRLTNADFDDTDPCTAIIGMPVTNIAALFFAAREGLIYVNVHTEENTAGEIRGQLIGED
jgi:CHRD domain